MPNKTIAGLQYSGCKYAIAFADLNFALDMLMKTMPLNDR